MDMKGYGKRPLPDQVLDHYAISLDASGRDQYGLQWQPQEATRLTKILSSIGSVAGALIARPRHIEAGTFSALGESTTDPIIAHYGYERGPHAHPDRRIAETKEFFQSVIAGSFDASDHTQSQIDLVNRKHKEVGVLDPQTGKVRAEERRSFVYVAALFIDKMQKVLANNVLSSIFQPAVQARFYQSLGALGIDLVPADNAKFLRLHRRIILTAREDILRIDPELLGHLDDASRRVTAVTKAQVMKRLHLSEGQFAEAYHPSVRGILGL